MSYNINIEEILQEELSGAKIKVIGVGGGGGNMVNHMIRNEVQGIEMIVANTDAQVLGRSFCENRIQLGAKLTKGLGAGMVPEIGRESALENGEEIRSYLEGADIVFIAAGLGGGTGTGAAPVIAQIAREAGALTISIVTKPFLFEGGKRDKLARAGLEELKKESDSIVVIPNDKLLTIVDKSLGIKESFGIVDEVLSRAVIGTSGIILSSGENDINLDFADLRTVMSHRGLALMGMGQAEGEKSAYEAIKGAIESPLLDDVSIQGAMGILVHFNIPPSFSIVEISSAMDILRDSADPEATIIMGTTTDETLPDTFVKITLIATGFEKVEDINSKSIKSKASDGTNLNVIQRRVIKQDSSLKEDNTFQDFKNQQEIPEDKIQERNYQQPSANNDNSNIHQQQNNQNSQSQQYGYGNDIGGQDYREPRQNSFGQHSQQQSRQNSFGQHSQQQSRQNSFGQQNRNSQHVQKRQNSFQQHGNLRNQEIAHNSFGNNQDKNGSSEEYLDIPTWMRQRDNK